MNLEIMYVETCYLTIAKEKIFKKGPNTCERGCTHASVSDSIMVGALIITVDTVSETTAGSIIFNFVHGAEAAFEKATTLLAEGAMNAFDVPIKRAKSKRILKAFNIVKIVSFVLYRRFRFDFC